MTRINPISRGLKIHSFGCAGLWLDCIEPRSCAAVPHGGDAVRDLNLTCQVVTPYHQMSGSPIHGIIIFTSQNRITMFHLDVMALYERELKKLKEELNLYNNQEDLWKLVPGTANSAGNLILHLVGNLRHFIGAVLGNTGYVRQRDQEFSDKNVDKRDLEALIDVTILEVNATLSKLDPAVLTQDFPKEIGGVKRDTMFVMLHLLAHLNYHLGQVNYHRRFISSPER